MSNVKRIQVIPSQIDRPASQEGITLTGTYSNLPYNKNAIKRLQAIVGDNFEGDLNIFDNEEGSFKILPLERIQQLLTQVLIRFDNSPDYYTKSDYQYLIWYLCQSLGYSIQEGSLSSEQLYSLKQEIQLLKDKLEQIDPTISSILERIITLESRDDSEIYAQLELIRVSIRRLEELINNQITIGAGSGIEITREENNSDLISAVYTGDEFTVNVNIGSLQAGQSKIEKGQNIIDILRQMLTKYIKCVIKSQTAVSFANQSKTVEYNGSINVTVTPTVKYGTVESEDPNYIPENTTITQEIDTDKPYSDLSSGWSQEGTSLVKTFSNVTKTISDSNIAKCCLTPNSTPIKDNRGDEQQDLNIADQVTISGSVTITPYQYVYYGFIDNSEIGGNNVQISNITDIMIKDLNRIAKNCPVAAFTQNVNLSTAGGQSFVIAMPSNRTLDKMVDQNNSDIKYDHPNFQIGTVGLDYNGTSVEYNLYLYPLRDPFTCNTFKLS